MIIRVFWFLGVDGGSGNVGMVKVAWGVRLSVKGGGVDVSKGADLSGGGDGGGLGGGGARWWVRYRFPIVNYHKVYYHFGNA